MVKLYFYHRDENSTNPMFDFITACERMRQIVEGNMTIRHDQDENNRTRAYLIFDTEEEAALFKLTKL